MLCSSIALPVCLGIIFIDVIVKLPISLGSLPPGAEDEIVLIEHLPGRRVHLQDFFWTGAEDAPPWLDPDQTLSLYETRTIHHTATIYIPEKIIPGSGRDEGPAKDPRSSPYDPGCVTCIDPTPTIIEADQDIGILVGEDPGPRYWLLTVLRSGEKVPSNVELRLARLYRAAFSRQQQGHLGLLAKDPRLRRDAIERRVSTKNHRSITDQLNFHNNRTIRKNNTHRPVKLEATSESTSDETKVRNFVPKLMRRIKISRDFLENVTAVIKPEQSSPERDRLNDFSSDGSSSEVTKSSNEVFIEEQSSASFVISSLIGPRGRLYRTTDSPVTPSINVSAMMTNNVQSGDSGDIEASSLFHDTNAIGSLGNRSEFGNSSRSKFRSIGIGMVQVRMQNTSITETGSTRLIYTVHLGGKPVPAETASKDMALLSPQEVALELGVPVIIQSEPYLKETRPLALSRKRDAWLLVGAAGAAIILLALVVAGLVIAAKRKRAHSAVSAPPVESILKKDRGYTPTTPGFDTTGYTSETEARTQTDGTSQRQTPGSHSRSPVTPLTPESLEDDIQELSSDDDEELKRQRSGKSWDIEEYPVIVKKSRTGRGRITRTNAIEQPKTPVSMNSADNQDDNIETPEEARIRKLEDTASPHSYLSMPSCKMFPSMSSVEPLSKILEPAVVRHFDIEFETPEMERRGKVGYDHRGSQEGGFSRTRSALKDPGVVGPIVWDLRRQRAVEESASGETEVAERTIASGPVGRARRRLHELLEDSFSLFGARDARSREPACFSSRPSSAARSPDHLIVAAFSESRGKSAHVSPVATPINQPKTRPRTSLPRGIDREEEEEEEEEIPETGNAAPHPRGAWGSRPLSAGPFHRPNLPEINVNRVLADHQLPPEDPAVPLIAAIRKELDKFTPEMRS